ncbi:MAG: YdcF family protein [Acutalibacteraceae bacterium]
MPVSKLAALTLGTLGTAVGAFFACEAFASRGNLDFEPDFLLILGCRVKADEPEPTLRTRIKKAAEFLTEHKNTIAVCCGGIVHPDQTKSEAEAIKDGLVSLGIDEGRIILEDKSTTTKENFVNAKRIIDGMKLEAEPKIAFLSSEFHLMRSSFIAKLTGLDVKSVAAPSPENQRLKNYIRELIVFPGTIAETMKKED